MIERYDANGTLVRRLPSSELIDIRVDESDGELLDYQNDLGNQLPEGFEMENRVVTIVGIVETDMDQFGQGNTYSLLVHLEEDPEGLAPWSWFQGHNSVVVKKVLGVYGKKGVRPIRGRLVRRKGDTYPTPYWDLADPNAPLDSVALPAKRK